jgi:CubicO group peptidase (beta-lactamase class C family)
MRHSRLAFAAAIFLVSIGASATKQEVADSVFSKVTDPNSPGLAAIVIQHGRVVFQRGYGLANLESGEKITAQTNFRLASLTKQFTATCIMLLVRDGRLTYEEPLTDFFPDFPAWARSITVRNLLNHTAGLPDYGELLMRQYANMPVDQVPQIHDAGVLQLMKRQPGPKFPAGKRFEYSNTGYAVLAMVVEKVSGQVFGQFLHDRIFAPLHMRNTVAYVKGSNTVPQRAYGYRLANGKWQFADQSPTSAVLGDGGIYTSIDDMARWDEGLRKHKLLSARDMRPALTPVKLPAGSVPPPGSPGSEYGFGWFLEPYKGHRRMSHDGGTTGFRTTIQRFPDDQLTVIVFANREDLDPEQLALRVADRYLGIPAALTQGPGR